MSPDHLLAAWPGTAERDLAAVETVIARLHEADPKATAFRYPYNLEGERSWKAERPGFNLRIIYKAITEVTEALDAAETGINAENEARQDADAEIWPMPRTSTSPDGGGSPARRSR